jgi:hypothetical protein
MPEPEASTRWHACAHNKVINPRGALAQAHLPPHSRSRARMQRHGSVYYQPSGDLPQQTWLGLAACLPLAAALAVTYAWLRHTWLTGATALPLVLLIGAALAVLLRQVARRTRLRHPWAGVWLAVGIGSVAWHTQAAVGLALRNGDWLQLWSPACWLLLLLPNANDLSTGTGASALLAWFDWLALCLPAALLLPWQARQPFCETRQAWIKPNLSPRRFCHIDDVEGFVRRAEGNPSDLVSLFDRPAESPHAWAQARVYRRAAGHDCYLRIDNVRLLGQRQQHRLVLRPMRITPYQAAALLTDPLTTPIQPVRPSQRSAH